jgi:hypothetical protein
MKGEKKGGITMKRNSSTLDLLIGAMVKLSGAERERQNVLAFVESCYCGHVRDYDLESALNTLAALSEEEQHALIAWIVAGDDAAERKARRSAA